MICKAPAVDRFASRTKRLLILRPNPGIKDTEVPLLEPPLVAHIQMPII